MELTIWTEVVSKNGKNRLPPPIEQLWRAETAADVSRLYYILMHDYDL
jgi:hypothetical protein